MNFGALGVLMYLCLIGGIAGALYGRLQNHPRVGEWLLYQIFTINILFASRQTIVAVLHPIMAFLFVWGLVRLVSIFRISRRLQMASQRSEKNVYRRS
jgi:hypothetical protein